MAQQVKLFKGIESECEAMQEEINTWIRESQARVIQISGNIAPQTPSEGRRAGAMGGRAFEASDLFVVVLYELP